MDTKIIQNYIKKSSVVASGPRFEWISDYYIALNIIA